MGLLISESFVDLDKEMRYGDTPVYEAYTENRGELFRSCQKEWGRCVSKVYVDKTDGKVEAVGWVFHKRVEYDDARNGETYLREVWVHIHGLKEEE